jgi:hypothetical protein
MKMTTLSSFWRLSGVSVILPSGTFCLASASEVLVQKHVLYTTADTHVGGVPLDPQDTDHIVQAL